MKTERRLTIRLCINSLLADLENKHVGTAALGCPLRCVSGPKSEEIRDADKTFYTRLSSNLHDACGRCSRCGGVASSIQCFPLILDATIGTLIDSLPLRAGM